MRHYIEEIIDDHWDNIKTYVLTIKNFSDNELFDEIIKNHQELYKDEGFTYVFDNDWISEYKNALKTYNHISLIAKAVEEKYYIFQDEYEHLVNTSVVEKILSNSEYIHRWDKIAYK